jgi:hypothetical protein
MPTTINLENVLMRGLRSAQPAAGVTAEGTLYFVTDEGVTEQVRSATWVTYSNTVATIGSGQIVSGFIASGQVGGFHLSSGCVTSGRIASGQIGINHLASGLLARTTQAMGRVYISGSAAAIHYNNGGLSSVTYNGVGDVTVNIATAVVSGQWSAVYSTEIDIGGAFYYAFLDGDNSMSVSALRLLFFNSSLAAASPRQFSVFVNGRVA